MAEEPGTTVQGGEVNGTAYSVGEGFGIRISEVCA